MDKLSVERRREEVWRLKRMGWTYDRIAEYLNTPEKTIENDMKIIKAREESLAISNQKLIEDTAKGIAQMLEKYQTIEKEAWECYMMILDPVERIKALSALTKCYADVAKLLKLIDYNQSINIEKFIKIENLVPMLNQVIMVIDKYIPEDKKVEAYKEIKQLEIFGNEEKSEPR
jgi:IS30 family transposase